MALIQCPECGAMVSDQATSCPKCGTPFPQSSNSMNSTQPFQQPHTQQPAYQQVNNYPVSPIEEEKQPNQACRIIGIILIILGILDYCLGNFAGIDITGVWWSPIVLGAIGSSLMAVKQNKNNT